MNMVDRRSFASAREAFEAFDADSVPFSRSAAKKLVQLGTALSTLKPNIPLGGFYRPSSTSVSFLMQDLLKGKLSWLTTSTWKCAKVKGSDDVRFYSDSYRLGMDTVNELYSACHNVGLEVHVFEWDYPRMHFDPGYTPTKKAKILGGGYKHLYRGKLVGFVLGAYDNPLDARKKRGRAVLAFPGDRTTP